MLREHCTQAQNMDLKKEIEAASQRWMDNDGHLEKGRQSGKVHVHMFNSRKQGLSFSHSTSDDSYSLHFNQEARFEETLHFYGCPCRVGWFYEIRISNFCDKLGC